MLSHYISVIDNTFISFFTFFIFKEAFNIMQYYVRIVLPLWKYNLPVYFHCVKKYI